MYTCPLLFSRLLAAKWHHRVKGGVCVLCASLLIRDAQRHTLGERSASRLKAFSIEITILSSNGFIFPLYQNSNKKVEQLAFESKTFFFQFHLSTVSCCLECVLAYKLVLHSFGIGLGFWNNICLFYVCR